MKIGIDISQIVYRTGVSRYTEKLVKNLLAIDRENEYILLGYSFRQKNFLSNYHATVRGSYCRGKIYPFPPTLMEFLWNRLHFVNAENFTGMIDIFHSSDWIQPPAEAKKITTVHDVSFLHYPESFPRKIIEVHQRRLKWVKKECDLVIADSKATKLDLVNLLGFDERKVRVIYLGADKVKSQKSKFKMIMQNLKLTNKYLLYIGTLQPRKNLIRLIEAFGGIEGCEGMEKIKLVLVGKKGWLYDEIFQKVKELGLEDRVIFTDYVTEEEKASLLENATAFIYPSFYEGFGLPVLEAMAAGCPVITADVSSLPEISGNAAILVDPRKTEEIAAAIKKLIADPELRRQLSERGRKQAEKFTWKKTAWETLKVYKELNEGRN